MRNIFLRSFCSSYRSMSHTMHYALCSMPFLYALFARNPQAILSRFSIPYPISEIPNRKTRNSQPEPRNNNRPSHLLSLSSSYLLHSRFRLPHSHFPFRNPPPTFYPACYRSISKGETSALFLASANRVYLAMVQARCSAGSMPVSRCSRNASRTW